MRVQVFYSHHNGSCKGTSLGESLLAAYGEGFEIIISRSQHDTVPIDKDALVRVRASLLDGYRRPDTMHVGRAEYVSINIDSAAIEFARNRLSDGNGQILLSAVLEGGDNFIIDTLDKPVKQLDAKIYLDWDWIIEPTRQSEALPLIIRVAAFKGSSEEPVGEIVMLKHLDMVPVNKTLGDKVKEWLTSLSGAVASLTIILGGVWATIGFVRAKGRAEKSAVSTKKSY